MPVRFLIVNADDFGASRGINRGILEAHRRGILTSTSLMVDRPGSEHAAALGREAPGLSIGLHVELGAESGAALYSRGEVGEALRSQLERFRAMTGGVPTHIDSHHNVHRHPDALPVFLKFARHHGLPLREHSAARYYSKFYGQWGGRSHLEQVSVESLVRILAGEIGEGVTELSCHPGRPEPDYPGSYRLEREAELRTLCDPVLREVLAAEGIQLINYRDRDKLGSIAATGVEG